MSKIRTAAIIGGGIAGPVAALALQRADIEATIFETYPGPAEGIGGSLAIAPNGMAALEIIGARDSVEAVALPVAEQAMSVKGKTIVLPSLAAAGPLQMVQRGDVYKVLQDRVIAAGLRIEYGRRLVSVEESARSVTAVFADGTTSTADVLIGADGVRSTVRSLIDPDAPGPRYTGMLGFEGLADVSLPHDSGAMTFAFGKNAYYLYWQRPDGGVGWGANLPFERALSLAEAREIPAERWLSTLRDIYAPDTPGGEIARRTTVDHLQVVGALYIMPSVPHWYRGRMVLVGDAVHAPSNSSGQGASLAIESAIQVARCLRDKSDVGEAFAEYEKLRRARVEKVAARAAKINHAKAPGPIMQAMMPIMMPLLMKTAMNPEKTIGPEQRYRIDWAARV